MMQQSKPNGPLVGDSSEMPELKVCKNDMSVSIGDICFRAVEPRDFKIAFSNDQLREVILGSTETYARFDMFKSDGMKFCAHLDMFYDKGGEGNMALTVQRDSSIQSDVNQVEIRITNLPASMILGAANLPTNRSQLTESMLYYGKYLHDWSMKQKDISGWIGVPAPGLQQRCNVESIRRNDGLSPH